MHRAHHILHTQMTLNCKNALKEINSITPCKPSVVKCPTDCLLLLINNHRAPDNWESNLGHLINFCSMLLAAVISHCHIPNSWCPKHLGTKTMWTSPWQHLLIGFLWAPHHAPTSSHHHNSYGSHRKTGLMQQELQCCRRSHTTWTAQQGAARWHVLMWRTLMAKALCPATPWLLACPRWGFKGW